MDLVSTSYIHTGHKTHGCNYTTQEDAQEDPLPILKSLNTSLNTRGGRRQNRVVAMLMLLMLMVRCFIKSLKFAPISVNEETKQSVSVRSCPAVHMRARGEMVHFEYKLSLLSYIEFHWMLSL